MSICGVTKLRPRGIPNIPRKIPPPLEASSSPSATQSCCTEEEVEEYYRKQDDLKAFISTAFAHSGKKQNDRLQERIRTDGCVVLKSGEKIEFIKGNGCESPLGLLESVKEDQSKSKAVTSDRHQAITEANKKKHARIDAENARMNKGFLARLFSRKETCSTGPR